MVDDVVDDVVAISNDDELMSFEPRSTNQASPFTDMATLNSGKAPTLFRTDNIIYIQRQGG